MSPTTMLKSRPAQAPAPPWRKVLPIHPAAELLPRMSEDELRELADDIKRRGLQSPVSIFTDADGVERLLDGINRLDAMEMAGLEIVIDGDINRDVVDAQDITGNIDPYDYALSANLLRRHLSNEQKREVIEKYLKAKPHQSDRMIAKRLKVDNKTVASVRTKLEAREEIPHVKTRTDTKGREQPAKKSKPSKAEQKVFESPQEAQSVVETPEVEEEEKPKPQSPGGEIDPLTKQLHRHLNAVRELCEDETKWPKLNPGRQKRRAKAIRRLWNAWEELIELAKPAPQRGRPRKTVEA